MSEAQKSAGAIFEAAVELPVEQRLAFLETACAGDGCLRQRVEALLHAHDAAGSFMDSPALGPTPKTIVLKLADQSGETIGRYKLLQQIGEGGCGVVYLAEQQVPVRRQVALKVIKLGMDTKQVVARFEAERQALALMDHPNIAKVLDGGATGSGRPYFVMELVRGVKITDYCDDHKLGTTARLELFIQVCQAIQHAHQKGIIHRDLKPSNILVTLHGDKPVPKVIDFGVAKATAGRLTEKTLFTSLDQFIGTPAYMSPEQAKLSALDIDTRSDIYSLGVLLYELLTGKTPFESKRLLEAGLDEIRRVIREEEPAPPSTRLFTMTVADLTDVAKHRQTEPAKLSGLIRGDLDWIVMKALEKDRFRRYETASGFARDLQRYLDNEPVSARPPGRIYRIRKRLFRQLNMHGKAALFILTAGVAMALLAFAVGLFHYRTVNGELNVRVLSSSGKPLSQAHCKLVVGGFPFVNGQPGQPNAENRMAEDTDADGRAVFLHKSLSHEAQNNLYVEKEGYSGATRFFGFAGKRTKALTIVLFNKKRVHFVYAFQAKGRLELTGDGVISGGVTLDAMDDGSYRPPANDFFSFKQDKPVGSSGVLDVGIAIDERDNILYFGGSNERFDHCTDLGQVGYETVTAVSPASLVRERKDTPILPGHVYIYESNIYPPNERTAFTGSNVAYAKILVASVEEIPSPQNGNSQH